MTSFKHIHTKTNHLTIWPDKKSIDLNDRVFILSYMLRKVNGFILLLLMVFAPQLHGAASNKYILQEGETIHYDVYALGIHVAHTTLSVKGKITIDGKKYYHVRFETISTPEIASAFYLLHDTHNAYLDPKTLLAVKYDKKLDEGEYKNHVYIKFYRDKKKFFAKDQIDFRKGKMVSYKHPAVDILSLIFYIRGLNVDVSDKQRLSLVIHDRPQFFEGQITSQKKKGKYTIVHFEETDGGFTMDYTKDARRIPLRITMKGVRIFQHTIDVKAVLTKYSIVKE
ncbi:MAG: hypothetical protein IEMM0008_0718 [bacterium]|nr:MAG: hypothetical protein IEMM0008_0718 [bacterium]